MYERFTDYARKVMQLANQEAQRFNHQYIGSEHILLGLIREGSGVGLAAIKNLGVEPNRIRYEIETLIQEGSPAGVTGTHVQTPRAKKVIEYAMEEARALNHDYVGTEHVLLGLLRDDVGLAGVALMNVGLRLEQVRAEIRATLRRAEAEGNAAYSPQSRIGWVAHKKESRVYEFDDETKRRVRQLAEAIPPLQVAMEEAVARQEFSTAAELRDERYRCWKELESLGVPEWVWRNVKQCTGGAWTRFPLLDTLDREAGEPHPTVVSALPKPLMPPVRVVVASVPRFPLSALRAALPADDIFSPYCQAVVPLISPESLARFRQSPGEIVRLAFKEISNAETPSAGVPCCCASFAPRSCPRNVRDEVFAGLRRTNCDFVVFEVREQAGSLLGSLPSGTKLVEP